LSEEDLETLELLGQTLDVVQSVDTDDDLFALEFGLQVSGPLEDTGPLDGFDESIRVDTDGEGSDLGKSTFILDSVGLGRDLENSGAGREEMSSVVVGVESDCKLQPVRVIDYLPNEITLKNTHKDLSTDRQDPDD
jgi:hypothetical protein